MTTLDSHPYAPHSARHGKGLSKSLAARPAKKAFRLSVVVASLGVHGLIAAALFAGWQTYRPAPEPEVTELSLVPLATLFPAPTPPKASPAPKKAPPPSERVLRKVALRSSPIVQDKPAQHQVNFGPGLSDTALSGAAEAGSGEGGGACKMAARLQASLLKDTIAQEALANLNGRAIMVWNGAWVRFDGEDGNGLSAVREAVMWDIAFAPKACQDEQMHGLVVLKAGRGRIALGGPAWRWGDLVTRHGFQTSQDR